MYQEVSTILRENVPYVNLHRHQQTYLYMKLNSYEDNDVRKIWPPCESTYCPSFNTVIHARHRYVLEPQAKPHAVMYVEPYGRFLNETSTNTL